MKGVLIAMPCRFQRPRRVDSYRTLRSQLPSSVQFSALLGDLRVRRGSGFSVRVTQGT
jgi:hypothetical protein